MLYKRRKYISIPANVSKEVDFRKRKKEMNAHIKCTQVHKGQIHWVAEILKTLNHVQ